MLKDRAARRPDQLSGQVVLDVERGAEEQIACFGSADRDTNACAHIRCLYNSGGSSVGVKRA